MRRLVLLTILMGLFSLGSAWAQDVPKAEIYGGYALLHETDFNMHGFLTGFEGRINKTLGIAGEFGLHTKSVTEFGVDVGLKAYTFMAGPRASFQADKLRIFAHALVGGMRFSGGSNVSGFDINVGTTAFSMAFGGGLDYSINDRFSVRPVQLDFITSRASMLGETTWGNDIRYSGGIVIKFSK